MTNYSKHYLLLECYKDTPQGRKYWAFIVNASYNANIVKVIKNYDPLTMTIFNTRAQAETEQQIKESIYKKCGTSFADYLRSYDLLKA